MKVNTHNTVFVFDLDDTLYKESDYFLSGVNAVVKKILTTYELDITSYMAEKLKSDSKDLWGDICKDWNLPISLKESLIWEYRLHYPNIEMSDRTKSLLELLQEKSLGVVILTDGRSVTQRLKIKALGLSHIPSLISDEYGAEKPDPERFEVVERMYPSKDYVYVGDNLAKDFLAPKELGWTTFCLKDDGRNIHPQNKLAVKVDYLPKYWLTTLSELEEYLC